MTDTLSFYCTPLDDIIEVRVLTPAELLEEFLPIVKYYAELDNKVDVNQYRERIVSLLVPEWESIKRAYSVQKSKVSHVTGDARLQFLTRDIYGYLIDLYPDLSLQNLIFNININRQKDDLGSILDSIYDETEETLDKFMSEKMTEMLSGVKAETKHTTKPKTITKTTAYFLETLKKKLNNYVINQEEAVQSVIDALKLTETGFAPFSSLFFIGPTGNGKTRLAKKLGKEHFQDRFLKINCSEYSNAHEYAKLIGSPPGYIGHTDKSVLAEKAEKSNRWVFLFDEIEKAHHKFYDFLLSLLDDGTVTDANGKELDFSESLFIFTSNKGMQDQRIGDTRLGFGTEVINYEESRDLIKDSLKTHFSPEFLNRIDKIVFFNTLDRDDLIKVAKLELRDVPVKKTKELLNFIIDEGYSQEYGGRHLAKFIKNNISVLVADAMLNNITPSKGKLYTCKIRKGKPYLQELEKHNESKTTDNG